VLPRKHSSTHAVEEAYGYVQGESLKPYAALLTEAYHLPDHQVGDDMTYSQSLKGRRAGRNPVAAGAIRVGHGGASEPWEGVMCRALFTSEGR
jgi:hypothetical protein